MAVISVIVPVYKVERYLKRCVDSILDQTFRDFELILVDDGSPDQCGEICENMRKRIKGSLFYIVRTEAYQRLEIQDWIGYLQIAIVFMYIY